MLSIVFATALAAAQNLPPSLGISRPPPPAPPNVPASFPARDDSGNGEFESLSGTQNAAWLAERFSETSWQSDNTLRALNGNSPRTLDDYKKSSEYATAEQLLNLVGRWKAGNKTHTWIFDAAGPQGGMPLRALELEDLSGPAGYRVRATVHCYDAPDTCAVYRKKQSELLAPKPQDAAGDFALRQWRNRVFDEECIQRSVNMAQPRYPDLALRDGIGGVVIVGLLFNRCGNVRDTWIEAGSGSRDLDRAAVSKAKEWQIDLTSLPEATADRRVAKVPVRFELGY